MKRLLKKIFIAEANPKDRIVSLWFQMLVVSLMIWIPFFSLPAAIISWFVYLILWGTVLYDQWLEKEKQTITK